MPFFNCWNELWLHHTSDKHRPESAHMSILALLSTLFSSRVYFWELQGRRMTHFSQFLTSLKEKKERYHG